MSSNPYPFYDDGWNRILVGLAAGNVVALILGFTLPERVSLSHLGDPAWVPGMFGVILFFFYVACILGTIILWASMFTYWARAGRPPLWLVLLLFGAWGTAIAFLFLVYRRDLEAFRQHEAEELQHQAGDAEAGDTEPYAEPPRQEEPAPTDKAGS